MTAEPPAVDRDAGMTVYATRGDRLAGRVRESREDFRVDEIYEIAGLSSQRREGYVPIYSLTKAGVDTPHAVRELSEALKSNVNFAGLKDSDAVTTQYVSARSTRAADPPAVTGKGFEATRIGYIPRPITRGAITGNAFRIVIRTDADLSGIVEEVIAACSSRRLPNFFGYQRFGLKSMVNQRVGKAVLQRDFQRAVELLVGEPRRREPPEAEEARRLAREGRYGEAARAFLPSQDIEKRVAAYLARRPGEYLGAFRRVPIVPRRLLLQSYQAYLYNLTLSSAVAEEYSLSEAEDGDNWAEVAADGLRVGRVHGVKEPRSEGVVPLVQLVGYAFRDYGSRFDRLILAVLKDEGMTPSAFYVKEAEEVSNEGGFRSAPLLATGLMSDTVSGGIALGFNMGRGEYATTLLREVLKPEDPLASGF